MLLPALVAITLSFATARPLAPALHALHPRACTHGTWLCADNALSVCMDGEVVPIWECGDGMTCAADPYYSCMENAPAQPTLDLNTFIASPSDTEAGMEDCEEVEECEEDGSESSEEPESTSAPAATSGAESTDGAGPTSAPEPTAAPESIAASEATSTPESTVYLESRSEAETTTDDHTISHTATAILSTVASTVGSPALPSSSFATNSTGTKHTTPQVSFAGPHYAIYSDFWFTGGTMPTVQQLGKYNRLILTMWTTGKGAMDNALLWTQLDAATRRRVLDEYHAAGIALMLVALGDVSQPTTQGVDPVPLAQELAKFVIDWEFDGVDVDYEDFAAVNGGTSAAWVIDFHKELRSQLGSAYLISHAPVAPFLSAARDYADGAYITINKEVGSTIDFYMVQYHNQGTAYTDCETLIYDAAKTGANSGTSIQELHDLQGIPYDKLAIGKPLIADDTKHGGYLSPEVLGECYQVAKQRGFTPGLAFWHWHGDVDNAGILSTIIGG